MVGASLRSGRESPIGELDGLPVATATRSDATAMPAQRVPRRIAVSALDKGRRCRLSSWLLLLASKRAQGSPSQTDSNGAAVSTRGSASRIQRHHIYDGRNGCPVIAWSRLRAA